MDLENVEASQPSRVYHSEQDESPQGRAELANACANMWAMALGWYYRDASAALRELRQIPDGGEALDDLTGSRELLANLCEPIDADPQQVGDAMVEALDAGRKFEPGRMNRTVPERAEDYGTWQAQTKGKTVSPWRETGGALGLGR